MESVMLFIPSAPSDPPVKRNVTFYVCVVKAGADGDREALFFRVRAIPFSSLRV